MTTSLNFTNKHTKIFNINGNVYEQWNGAYSFLPDQNTPVTRNSDHLNITPENFHHALIIKSDCIVDKKDPTGRDWLPNREKFLKGIKLFKEIIGHKPSDIFIAQDVENLRCFRFDDQYEIILMNSKVPSARLTLSTLIQFDVDYNDDESFTLTEKCSSVYINGELPKEWIETQLSKD